MADAPKSITSMNTKMSNTIEDFFKILLKMTEDNDILHKSKDFLSNMDKAGVSPVFISLESIAAKRLEKEMENKGIAYVSFQIKDTSKDMILIHPDDKLRVQDLENNIRIHAGLEIDTKAELDRAMLIGDPNAKEYIITGLTEYEANRVIQLAQKDSHPYTVVAEKQLDDTYLIACHEKREAQLNYHYISALMESSDPSKHAKNVVEANNYLNQQKKEIEAVIAEIRETNQTSEAYVMSMTNPEKYIHISEFGFELIDRNMVTHSMNISQNPDLYADALKFISGNVEYPLYKLAEEVREDGGIKESLEKAKSNMSDGFIQKGYPIDLAFKKWMIQTLNIENGYVIDNPNTLAFAKSGVKDFVQNYVSTHSNEAANADINLQKYEKTIENMTERLREAKHLKEMPKVNIYDLLAQAGIDTSLHEEFYSEKEVMKIKNGEHREDITHTEDMNIPKADIAQDVVQNTKTEVTEVQKRAEAINKAVEQAREEGGR